jgi:hypothetical protein
MNINRKLKMTSTAIISIGAITLGVLPHTAVLAATCDPITFCLNGGCPTQQTQTQICQGAAPAGCTFLAASCSLAGSCGPTFATLTCHYH